MPAGRDITESREKEKMMGKNIILVVSGDKSYNTSKGQFIRVLLLFKFSVGSEHYEYEKQSKTMPFSYSVKILRTCSLPINHFSSTFLNNINPSALASESNFANNWLYRFTFDIKIVTVAGH